VVCALVALEHSSAFETVRYRTYKLSSVLFCAGLVGYDVVVPLALALTLALPQPLPLPLTLTLTLTLNLTLTPPLKP